MRIVSVLMSAKVPLNLSMDAEVKRQMKIHCAGSGEDVSEVTEALYVKFLRSQGVKIEEPAPSYGKKKGQAARKRAA